MEKPIVARVNGDAIGFGASIAFASDLIVASEHARFMDHHMAGLFTTSYNGRPRPGGHAHFSVVPGDGGALMGLFLSPCRMKEYLMLCRSYGAAELERIGVINSGCPLASSTARLTDWSAGCSSRGAYAIAWAKRAANRHVAGHLNLSLDASVAYEMTSLYQLQRAGGQEPRTLQ